MSTQDLAFKTLRLPSDFSLLFYFHRRIITIIKITRLSVPVGDGRGRGWLGVVDTRYCVSHPVASGRGAHVYTCTCVHDNIPYRRLPK